MVRISEGLVRKRAEHNEMEISTLEELSLHQQDIEKIEYLDKWCRELRILYLQSNLIEKIENVSRLKKLEYINLALNNIERIENLEGCESLQKLDLTVNFVAELTSIACLKGLEFFRELYLTGNPCTDFEGYREYVIATLPHLEKLDGVEVEKSERIRAIQDYESLRLSIQRQQHDYQLRKQREEMSENEQQQSQQLTSGTDWYTDIKSDGSSGREAPADKEFWEKKVPYTPETRKQVHEHMRQARERGENSSQQGPNQASDATPSRRLFTADGRPLNVNEPKVDFLLNDEVDLNRYTLDVAVFKHMDTSLMEADVHPTYVSIKIKGKILQLALDEEVKPDSSVAQRSLTTGHLVITMPKAKDESPIARHSAANSSKSQQSSISTVKNVNTATRQLLEVDNSPQAHLDFANIVRDDKPVLIAPLGSNSARPYCSKLGKERTNSPDFVDDLDVPPLI